MVANESETLSGTLKGMKQIAGSLGVSEPTVLDMKRQFPNMPMQKRQTGEGKKKGPGIWISHRAALDEFMELYAQGRAHEYNQAEPEKQSKEKTA